MGNSNTDALVIASLDDVRRLHSSPTRLWSLDAPFELRIAELSAPERERLQSRLNELAGVCGCAEGAAAGALALLAVISIWIQREITFALQSLLTSGAIIIGVVLVAKFVRVTVARLLLHRLLGNLLQALQQRSPNNHRGVTP